MESEPPNFAFKSGPLVSRMIKLRMVVGVMLWLMLIALLLGACDFRKVVVNDPLLPQDVEFIVPGSTSMFEVVERLGAPDEISGTSNQLLFRYQFKTTKFFRFDFGVLLRIWTPITPPMSWGNGNAGTDAFWVAFDSHWQATTLHFTFSENTKKVSFWPF